MILLSFNAVICTPINPCWICCCSYAITQCKINWVSGSLCMLLIGVEAFCKTSVRGYNCDKWRSLMLEMLVEYLPCVYTRIQVVHHYWMHRRTAVCSWLKSCLSMEQTQITAEKWGNINHYTSRAKCKCGYQPSIGWKHSSASCSSLWSSLLCFGVVGKRSTSGCRQ